MNNLPKVFTQLLPPSRTWTHHDLLIASPTLYPSHHRRATTVTLQQAIRNFIAARYTLLPETVWREQWQVESRKPVHCTELGVLRWKTWWQWVSWQWRSKEHRKDLCTSAFLELSADSLPGSAARVESHGLFSSLLLSSHCWTSSARR